MKNKTVTKDGKELQSTAAQSELEEISSQDIESCNFDELDRMYEDLNKKRDIKLKKIKKDKNRIQRLREKHKK